MVMNTIINKNVHVFIFVYKLCLSNIRVFVCLLKYNCYIEEGMSYLDPGSDLSTPKGTLRLFCGNLHLPEAV